MCKDLARGNIMENIIPSTESVARVGDQGRDFLGFKTCLIKTNNTVLNNTSFFSHFYFPIIAISHLGVLLIN